MTPGHAEIVGAGFAGLTAACALAQRGWSVRVHERADQLRTTGAGIYVYENGLRVLEAVGAYEAAIAGAPMAHTREVRDDRNRVISVHRWMGSRVFSIVRQNIINALAGAATKAGVEIVTGSAATVATAAGELALANGQRLNPDLIVGADGCGSCVRDSLGLLRSASFSSMAAPACCWIRPPRSASQPMAPRPSSIGRARAVCSTRRVAEPTSMSH
jgi:2-polyprenyl-6-methoxyphenol hydroxylase-like FAD-dependent oxidoreductase